jgi:flavin-dependent dehydrogenase
VRLGERVGGRFREYLPALDIDPAGVDGCVRRSPGIVSSWGSSTPHLAEGCVDPYGLAWHLDRPAFEDLLRRSAVALGAEVLTDTRVVDARFTGARAWTVTMRTGGRTVTREASVIVDAAGRAGRDPFGRVRLASAQDVLVATAFILSAELRAPSSHWTLVEATADGWWYSAPLPGNRSSIVFFADRESPYRHVTDVRELAAVTEARLTIERIPHGQPIEEGRRVAAMVGSAPPLEGRHCVPIGDAALALDPLSGAGLSVAFETAIMAADAIGAAVAGRPEKISEYRARVGEIFSAHLAARSQFYAAETRWADRPFWRKRSIPPASPAH